MIAGKIINCCEVSPILDVIGFGLSDGSVLIHNLKLDTLIMEVKNVKAVHSLSFHKGTRSLLATGDETGVICLWDLNERRLLSK